MTLDWENTTATGHSPQRPLTAKSKGYQLLLCFLPSPKTVGMMEAFIHCAL